VTTLLITFHIAACIVLILVVLLQAGRGADMGAAFGGASSPMFGSGSSTNPLARVTTATAITFLATALFLAVASARRASVFDNATEPLATTPHAESAPIGEAQPATIPATADSAPAAKVAPAAGGGDEAAPAASDDAAPAAAPAAAAAAAPAAPAEAAAPTAAVAPAAAAPAPAAAPGADAPPAASPAGK
jgi:preprotein translocase subunit SecG